MNGTVVRYVLPDGTNITFPIRRPEIAQVARQEPCPSSLYLTLGSATYVEMRVAEEQRRRHDAGEQPLMGAEHDAFRAERTQELVTRRAEMGYSSADAFLAAIPDAQKDSDGVPGAVSINCNLTLQPADRIFARLRLAGPESSNVTIECRCSGARCARISNPFTVGQIRAMGDNTEPVQLDFVPTNCGVTSDAAGGYIDSRGAINSRCDPVMNVTVNGCRIDGRIRATSIGGELALYSSPRADHVDRLRASAAQHLQFNRVRIAGKFRTPLHLLPGVHHVAVRDSTIRGGHAFSTIYLPADGGWNELVNNNIYGQTGQWDVDVTEPAGGRREVIAIDGSEHNRIINNHIRRMPYGGIFLYRNCGELAMLRHRPPQYNQIINNVFDYEGGRSGHPAVFLGSREGGKGYCSDDLGPGDVPFAGNDRRFPWDSQVIPNSSESNGDWAGHNTVAQNQFVAYSSTRFITDFIRQSSAAVALDTNYVDRNSMGTSSADAVAEQRRRGAGCAVSGERNGYKPFTLDGETIDMFWSYAQPIRLQCGAPLRCTNGDLIPTTSARTCRIEEPTDDCLLEGSNAACSKTLRCPTGHGLVGVQAACNLESGSVSAGQLDGVLMSRVKVVRPSDNVSDGSCWAGGTSIAQGERRVRTYAYGDSVAFGCREHDRNGGDCVARVRMYCRAGGL